MDPDLQDYISQARAWGLSNTAITEALKEAGWNERDITAAYENSSEAAIEVTNVYKTFGRVRALSGLTIRVPYGKVFALLGPNGAGKTTLVRILTTLLKADWGDIKVAGFELPRYEKQVRSSVGVTGQYVAVDEILTGRENLRLVGRLYHLDKNLVEMRANELLRDFGLAEAADRPVKTYSGGMRRRLDLAASLINRPQIIFLDEPTSGLDPQSRNVLWRVIENLAGEGVTILLTTQYMEEADHLADYIFIIDHGRLVAEGTPRNLKKQFGSSFLEIHLAKDASIDRAVGALRQLGELQIQKNEELGVITLPVGEDPSIFLEAVRVLDRENIPLIDVMLRHPALNDVFLNLTGHEATSN
ncbi:MAG: ATP-binding cassette domain-containing protein [Candidatus Colwellbacteria bacterium]|nr:ATP-binding cassette domain-containing protein [Candidatus Colwellbacteria bacterium]